MTQNKLTGNNPLSKPPSPVQTKGETTLSSLPMLTEVVTEAETDLPHVLSAEEMLQLLHQLEAHIETLFTQKLGLRLEQLQRQAIEQAIGELKTELPELLRTTLNAYLDSR